MQPSVMMIPAAVNAAAVADDDCYYALAQWLNYCYCVWVVAEDPQAVADTYNAVADDGRVVDDANDRFDNETADSAAAVAAAEAIGRTDTMAVAVIVAVAADWRQFAIVQLLSNFQAHNIEKRNIDFDLY